MIKFLRRCTFLLLISLAYEIQVCGQFYNGHQMTFGKNRVQYNDFYWQYYRFENFDTYFNQFGKELAQFTALVAENQLYETERYFDYKLEKRIIFIIYNKLSDYRQSNIGLVTGKDEYNIGGVTRIIDNKVFIYYDGTHDDLQQQISASIAEVVINEMLYGSALRQNVANSTLIATPEWYLKGLISYISRDWTTEVDNHVRDGILTERYEKFNHLTGREAVFAGHSFWRYIAETYGETIIPNIIYLTRINKNVNNGFFDVLGIPMDALATDWIGYYQALYNEETGNPVTQENLLIEKPRRRRVYSEFDINPNGQFTAFVSNEMGLAKIWIYNHLTEKKDKIFRLGHRLDQETDYSYPIISWHPSGRILTFIIEEQGDIRLYFYTLATGELTRRNILFFDKILGYAFSDDGAKLVISGVKEGFTDIYVHTLASGTNEKITQDLADDIQPGFINNSESIIFSSNRTSDTLSVDKKVIDPLLLSTTYGLYIYDYKNKARTLVNLTENNLANYSNPEGFGRNEFTYLSDESGIVNRYFARFDSTISYVDTTTHYRYYTRSFPVTNYTRNILEQDMRISPSSTGDIFYKDRRHYLLQKPFDPSLDRIEGGLEPTSTAAIMKNIREQKEEERLEALKDAGVISDTAEVVTLREVLYQDTTFKSKPGFIDINNYVFEQEKFDYYNDLYDDKRIIRDEDTIKKTWPKIRIYQTAFYTNYLVNQIDFSFLNASYQAFTGGAVYYNPGFNLSFKLGANDLFEDYKIVGGLRLSGDFDSNEYLLSFENLKPRIDRQIIGHRQAFKNFTQEGEYIKTTTHELMYSLTYPFNQVAAIKGTASMRHDRTVFLSTSLSSLQADDIHKLWGGIKMEYIFDNTRNLGINLYSGTRFKVFGEFYKQVNAGKTDLWVVGADFRHYTRLHRTLIWANRFATSTSFGKSRLVYYLGSVDNWINIFPTRVQTFDRSIPIKESENYAYQTLATNMRGFTQNIRNGNNFAVFNSELRFPVFKYLINRPMSSKLLETFQVVGFFDVGSAWIGLTPYSGKNAYDEVRIPQEGRGNPITIILDSNRDPVVAGYGFGVRSQVFGYFVRLDWAWGIENNVILPRIFYLSLNLDF